MYKPKENHRNRAKLREVMANTKPAYLDTKGINVHLDEDGVK